MKNSEHDDAICVVNEEHINKCQQYITEYVDREMKILTGHLLSQESIKLVNIVIHQTIEEYISRKPMDDDFEYYELVRQISWLIGLKDVLNEPYLLKEYHIRDIARYFMGREAQRLSFSSLLSVENMRKLLNLDYLDHIKNNSKEAQAVMALCRVSPEYVGSAFKGEEC